MFRGLRRDGKGWVYGSGVYINQEAKHAFILIDAGWDQGARISVLPETVGQYTEMEMVNDSKLWSGDLVKVKEIIWVVEFGYDRDKSGLGWVAYPVDNPSVRLFVDKSILSGEIIGSIHTHKELIKQ